MHDHRLSMSVVIQAALFVALVGAPSATAAQIQDAAMDEAVGRINDVLRDLRDVTCTMIEGREPPAAAGAGSRPATLHFKPPDKARSATIDEYGNERLKIKNGSTEWHVLVPGSVTRTVWSGHGVPLDSPVPLLGPDAYRMLRSGMTSSKGRALRRVEYLGVEDVEGVSCHVFQTHRGSTRTWIAVVDGLIRRQERRGDDALHVTRFTDFRINVGLDDALFEYEPQEGAHVDVNEHVEGEWRRHRYRVPYTPVPPAASEQARAKLAELQSRFERVSRFSVRLAESYLAHAVRAIAADGRELPVGHEKTGLLLVAPPSHVRFEGERRDLSTPVHRRLLLISDGASVWMSDEDATAPVDQPRTVLKDRLLPAGAWKDRDRAEAILRGQPPEGTDITFELPAFVLAPLGGVDVSRIRFAGEEHLDGEQTCRFDVKATEQDAASTHWIGLADGIPRRIEIRNAFGNVVERTVRLSEVELDPALGPGTFTFENDGMSHVVDMQRRRARAGLPGVDG